MSIPFEPDRSGPHPKKSAREIAYDFIEERILRGQFEPGEFLDETALAAAIGLSRTPVREALHRLRAEQFIDLQPRRGAQVRNITPVEMQEIYETRIVIESAAYNRICRNRKKVPDLAMQILEQMNVAGDEEDWAAFGQLDQHFHGLLVRSAGNSVLHHLHETLRPQHVRIAIRAIQESPQRRPTIDREHRDILKALNEFDAAAASTLLLQHLRNIPEVVEALGT